MLVLPVWVNIRVSDDLGDSDCPTLVPPLPSLFIELLKGFEGILVGGAGGILCKSVFLVFFPVRYVI